MKKASFDASNAFHSLSVSTLLRGAAFRNAGKACLRRGASRRPRMGAVKVLVFSNYASGEEVFQAFKAGAHSAESKRACANVTAELVTDIVAGRRPSLDLAPYDPHRFSL